MELWADNTPIDKFSLTAYYIKYYHLDKFGMYSGYLQDFYLPSISTLRDITYHTAKDRETIKKEIAKTIQFKICRMLQVYNLNTPGKTEDDYEKYLDFLNYDEMNDPIEYREKNKEFINKSVF